MQTEAVIRSFVDAINHHDVARIVALCAEDHQFIDAYGAVTPAETLAAAWTGYFRFMPRYGIEVEEVLCQGDQAAVFGAALGSLDAPGTSERSWRRPAAWRAAVRDGLMTVWQVYVDTKIVFDLLSTPSPTAPGARHEP
jgi:ketosteroid isomerase-like protein